MNASYARATVWFLIAASLVAGACGGSSKAETTPGPPPQAQRLESEDILPLYTKSAVFIVAEGFYGGDRAGTGIVFDDQGDILTNNHVVDGAGSVTVRNPDNGHMIPAQIVGRSPCDDLAVIRVRDATPFKSAELGSVADLKPGSPVYAVGFPKTPDQKFDLTELSITGGLVSKLNAPMDYYGLENTIQFDAASNHGNSGGPLIDKNGKVVGVTTLGVSSLQNVSYAIAIDGAQKVIDQLITGTDLDWLGVALEPSAPEYEEQYGIPYSADSAVVFGLDTSSPLRAAKWQPGDLIVAAEKKIIRMPGDLCSVIRSHRKGDKILIEGYGQFRNPLTGDSFYDAYESEIVLP
jgi:serine protease Do